jgi:hypothetical protein
MATPLNPGSAESPPGGSPSGAGEGPAGGPPPGSGEPASHGGSAPAPSGGGLAGFFQAIFRPLLRLFGGGR